MMRLLAVELRRFRSRRVLWVLVALTLMAIAYAGGAAFWNEGFDLTDLRDGFIGAALALMLVGLILGASSIGAEWHAGTVATLLTWEPRRGRVAAAKILALLASVAVLGLAALALLGLVLALEASLRGSTEGVDGAWFVDLVGVTLRCEFLVCFAAAVGFGLAMIGRSTAGALGVAFGYMLVVENIVRGFAPDLKEWLVGENLSRFILARAEDLPYLARSTTGSGIYLFAVGCLVLAVAVGVFLTRDVT